MITVLGVVPIVFTEARVGGGLESELVGLHDVELWAVLSGYSLGITVIETISVVEVTTLIFSRRFNKIESGNTSASHLGKVDVILDGSSKKIRRVETLRIIMVTSHEL